MLNFRRQRSLTDSLKFDFTSGKLAVQPDFLSSAIVIAGISDNEQERKKFLSDNDFLRSAFDKSQQFFSMEGKFAQVALVSMENPCLFLGTGASKHFYAKNLFHLGGKIAQQIDKLKNNRVIILVDSFYKDLKMLKSTEHPLDFAGRQLVQRTLSREDALERLLTGILLGLYKTPNPKRNAHSFKDKNADKSKDKSKLDTPIEFVFASRALTKEKVIEAANRAIIKSEATYWVRDEAALPPNVLIPETFVKDIRELGDKSGFKIKVLDENRIQKDGFGGIWAVGKGSVHPPRLVIAEYTPAGASKVPHLVLIGKGVTFDTGGYSIKPAANMHEMKSDMTGAAVMTATLSAIAKEKLPIKVTALLPLVENMVSDKAFLPGDVYEAWGGVSVEVQNTDAEGRLILADCLAYAQGLEADLVIDMATLTGAASVTLGPAAIMLYGNNGEWLKKFKKVIRYAGEESWEMPLYDEYSDDLKSSVAHLRNFVGHREANSHVAAQFLNYFVDKKYPWIHLDIASYESTKWKGAHCPSDAAVGLPTPAMIEFAKYMASEKSRSQSHDRGRKKRKK
jgi:leucyl aminopeptidase